MTQRTFAFRRGTSQLIRVLFSDPSYEAARDCSARLIHRVCPNCRAIATVIPRTIREDDLLETAVKYRFDLAILVLNNVFYAPYDSTTRLATLAANGVSLLRRMIRLVKVPIIALYGWPDDAWHSTTLLQAGATAAFKLPFRGKEMKQALRTSLSSNP